MLGGLGWPEAAVLLLLGLFVFGPDRLPGIAQDVGRNLRKVRVYLKSMSEDLKAELGPEVADLDLRSLDPKEFVRKHLFEDEEDEPVPGVLARRQLVPGEAPPWDPDTT
ncbi:MAG: putative Sec-independent protein translocase protein (tatB) [Frankiales bacterium]|nr:putative Sec-independent protein translocase protein (tatB) [Frankiales bacterium]